MATSDSIQLALNTVDNLNSIKRAMRAHSESYRTMLTNLDSIMDNPAKKAILLDGLSGLGMDPAVLKTEKDDIQAVNQHILDNIPALTK